jgi:hypothetical protein
MRMLGAVFCQQHINICRVINTPTDNTSEEPLAQGKKLQKNRQNHHGLQF